MNFEQFTEEVRAAYSGAGVICATEQPLSVVVDGQEVDSAGIIIAHQPCWLRLDKGEILADSMDAVRVDVEFPARANLEVVLVIKHGASVVEETLPLDAGGKGELEIVSTTSGEILVAVKDKLVRAVVSVKEV